jgi:long-chain acyl-CoA synthetase
MYNTVLEAVLAHAEATPGKVAVADRERRITYGELAAMIRTTAANLREAGVHKGDRVMLAAVPFVRFAAAYFGCHYIGAVACPVDKNAVKDSLLWMRDFLETDAVFYEGPLAGELGFRDLGSLLAPGKAEAGPPAELDGGDLADIIFTSATTGRPKGVMLTHKNLWGICRNRVHGCYVSNTTAWLINKPLHTVSSIGAVNSVLSNGGEMILVDGISSLRTIYEAIKNNNVTHTVFPPSAINIFFKLSKGNICPMLGSLKMLFVGGAMVPLNMRKQLLESLPATEVLTGLGCTEASCSINLNLSKDKKIESQGKALPGVEIKVIDDVDTVESNGRRYGRLAIRGDMVMKGYWKDEARTKEALVDGWLITNDLAYIDDEGYVFLFGRVDDVINIGGNKTTPAEIEDAVNSCDDIFESCCIAVDDPQGCFGQAPVVFVKVDDKNRYSEARLREHLASRLERYKLPYKIILIDEIPKNASGKMLRKELKTLWQETAIKL